MAAQADVDSVKVQLPDEAADFGFTDAIVSANLDSGNSVTKVILIGWRAIAAKTATATDVNESGSSRNFSQLNQKAMAMVTHWQMIADREDSQSDTLPRQRFASHTIARV